ncbi:CocE/NonD family hydrolase [Pseudomonas typographi]|uniref:CocE/NonD family hydrolase n=1 Tax=Pseudomonas typographi TaxID=2715964 RepID=UPI001685617D|nr:CocE/NonD family hydrolase [Pseudomonas typographi]MBD1552728.1 CocE/NonD family hydrolase [Pseudomonas typographi]
MQHQETVWITLADGCRLAARVWLPEAADKVPAVLEYLPYRRRDRHRGDDAILHPGLAAAGYAAVRVDMRGAGDSDGLLHDEYTPQEWADCTEVIAWIAAQPWCSGAVGMIGISWSGFNSLQVAALQPPALKAIVTACSTDDRYADDMHYMGGVLLNDNLQYGSTLFTWTPTPPDPLIVGERWRAMWLERLQAMALPPPARWMRHATRDAYWRSGSVCEAYPRIQVPVLAVGGWADGYTNAVPRLLANLSGPRKGLIGPWAHAFPHVATPGPRIDFIGYVVRWFDHWLKGIDNGIMAEPMLSAWLQEAEPPKARYETRRGRWIAEQQWPSPAISDSLWHLAPGRLAEQPAAAFALVLCSPATTGSASGEWCPYGWGPDMPTDQREDDAGSLCFDGEPLGEPLQLLGNPRLRLTLCSDTAMAMLAVRLCAVAADGSSQRVSYGLLNLAQRDGHHRQVPLLPGMDYQVEVQLKACAFEVPAGYRLRVAVSSAYWPLAAPLPWRATLTLRGGVLALPRRDATVASCQAPALGQPWSPPALPSTVLVPPQRGRLQLLRDLASGDTRMNVVRNLGALLIEETGLELGALGNETYSINADDPATARSEALRTASFSRGDWSVRLHTRNLLTASADGWQLESSLEAFEGEQSVFRRDWDEHFAFFPAQEGDA